MTAARLLLLSLILASCSRPDPIEVFTLYRNSPVGAGFGERFHIATFDANQSEGYNQENCFLARDLFQLQPGVGVDYWCEAGRYSAAPTGAVQHRTPFDRATVVR